MATVNYVIKRSDGTTYATIPNDVILGPNQPGSNPVPLNFVGRNKVGYGQASNENFLHLVENFTSSNAPYGNVKGQLWYKATGSTPGEFLLALQDNAQQPVDTATEGQWAAIPMITLFNTIPDGTNSVMGRMILTNNGDTLRVLMKNKEWREVLTRKPQAKEYEALLDINYDSSVNYIEFTQTNSTKPIAYFNTGGDMSIDSNGWTSFETGNGVFQFGTNYFYEMKIMFREVSMDSGSLLSVPSNYKTWKINGSFYVDNKGTITPGSVPCSDLPDPRRIASLETIKDVITSATLQNDWDVSMVINDIDSSIPNPTGVTKAAYEQWVINSLNSSKTLGFRVDGTVSGLSTGQTVKIQPNISIKILGIPALGV